MISVFTNCSFLGNDDRLFIYEEEGASRPCHVRAWYDECFDFVAGRCPCPLGNAALGEKEDPLINSMKAARVQGLVPSIQSEAVTSELQELSLHPAPEPVPLQERKNGETVPHAHFWLSRASFMLLHLHEGGCVKIASFLDLLSPPHVPHLPKIVTRWWEDWPDTDQGQPWLVHQTT